MRDSLTRQAGLATAYLSQAWPGVLEQAREFLATAGGGLRRVLVCGCGDSHCAALGAEFGLRHWSGLPLRGAESMQASRYLLDGAGPDLLVVGISSSGEVARTLEAVEVARRAGARTLAVTCSSHSSLAACAEGAIAPSLPAFPPGPGLLSYLAALQACTAIAAVLSTGRTARRISELMDELPGLVEADRRSEEPAAEAFAEQVTEADQGVFVGSGPCRAAAEFSAAKVMEACGLYYRGQDVEEWSHLEYFVEPPGMPTWILSAGGRAATREAEVESAAAAIGRRLLVSRWQGGKDWSREEREALAPLALWVGPVAFAQRLMAERRAEPFRGFGGGRSAAEGGGASRIRSSDRTQWREQA